MTKATATAPVVDETPTDETEATEPKRRGKVKEPFGRNFHLTVRFHDDLSNADRDLIVTDLLSEVQYADDADLTSRRSTRGDPNPDQHTWSIAPAGYDWPEAETVQRGVRIPQGPLAEALRKFAQSKGVSIEQAAAMFAEAYGLS